jgi:hypothetical protein
MMGAPGRKTLLSNASREREVGKGKEGERRRGEKGRMGRLGARYHESRPADDQLPPIDSILFNSTRLSWTRRDAGTRAQNRPPHERHGLTCPCPPSHDPQRHVPHARRARDQPRPLPPPPPLRSPRTSFVFSINFALTFPMIPGLPPTGRPTRSWFSHLLCLPGFRSQRMDRIR